MKAEREIRKELENQCSYTLMLLDNARRLPMDELIKSKSIYHLQEGLRFIQALEWVLD
jgi:hypothetical protein